MVAQVTRVLGIPEIIDSLVRWDPKQCKHSPGTHVWSPTSPILALIVNILMGRTALYRVEESYENLDVPILSGWGPRRRTSTTPRWLGRWTKSSRRIRRGCSARRRCGLPAVFNQEKEVRDKAWAEGGWTEVGVLTCNRRPDSAVYKCKEYAIEIFGRPYRLSVVHSSKLDKRKADKLERDLGEQKAELEEKVKKLSALEFVCEPDARAALERLKRESDGLFYNVSGDVEAEEVILKQARPGRPRKGEATPTKTVYKVKASVGALNEQAYAEARLRALCFVLITSIDDTKKFPPERVLREYKGQTSVELHFRAIKEPEFVGAMYVKKPERLEALAYVVLLAALVRAIIERRARRYAEATGEGLPIPGKRTSTRPTARMILDSFDPIIVVILPDGTRVQAESRLFPDKMFKALGISPSVYLSTLQENAGP